MKIWVMIMLLGLSSQSLAFDWQDLWHTKDQQGKILMDQGQFDKAQNTFIRQDWQATSAFRAKQYEQAAKLFHSIKTDESFYNEGNALAYAGQYKQAINAYNQSLQLNPEHKDALHNRKVVEELLKKNQDKQNEEQQNQDKQDQDKQDQDKQNQDKQNQDKQDQDKQDQDKQNQDKQDQDKQNQDKQDQDKQDQEQNQDKQNQDKQDQDKQDQDKQDQDKQNQRQQDQDKDEKNQSEANKQPQSPMDKQLQREKQQAKEQWLRLIPDDPGGLLREKFLRDHLRRQSLR